MRFRFHLSEYSGLSIPNHKCVAHFLPKKTWLIHLSQNQSILEMIQTPVIVTFANQKGGVGKTTLASPLPTIW